MMISTRARPLPSPPTQPPARPKKEGNTPFSVALFHDHRRVLKELLRAGARVHFLGHKASGTDSWKLVDAVRKVPGGWANYAARRASDVERATTPPTLPGEIRRLIVAFVEPPGGY